MPGYNRLPTGSPAEEPPQPPEQTGIDSQFDGITAGLGEPSPPTRESGSLLRERADKIAAEAAGDPAEMRRAAELRDAADTIARRYPSQAPQSDGDAAATGPSSPTLGSIDIPPGTTDPRELYDIYEAAGFGPHNPYLNVGPQLPADHSGRGSFGRQMQQNPPQPGGEGGN